MGNLLSKKEPKSRITEQDKAVLVRYYCYAEIKKIADTFCLGRHLNLRDLVQKNFWRIFFFENFSFLNNEVESTRPDASGPITKNGHPNFYF